MVTYINGECFMPIEEETEATNNARRDERERWATELEELADRNIDDVNYRTYLRAIAIRMRKNDPPPFEGPKQIEPIRVVVFNSKKELEPTQAIVGKINELVEVVNKLSRNQEDRS